MNHVLLTACRDNEKAEEDTLSNRRNGVFTYYLCNTIRDTLGQLTYQELMYRVQQSLRFHGYDQTPQLEGEDVAQPIFPQQP